MKFIQEHNLAYDRGEISYFVGENHLSDLVCNPYFYNILFKNEVGAPLGRFKLSSGIFF